MFGPALCAPPARLKLRILPLPCRCITGQTARVQRKVVRRLLFSSESQSATESSAEGPYFVRPPARLTRISIRPYAASVSSTRWRAPSSLVRSAAIPITLISGCAASKSSTRALTRSALRELIATLAPSQAKAVASAMPTWPAWLTPVITATLPARRWVRILLVIFLFHRRFLKSRQRQAAVQYAQREKRTLHSRRADADAQGI